MALRSAYKERLGGPRSDREELGSNHSVGNLTRGGNHSYNPAGRGNPTPRKTSDVIENAFGFLGDDQYDAYSRFNSDQDPDDIDIGINDNFSFGPPRDNGFGPSPATYDRREVPIGADAPFRSDQSAYDAQSIGLAKGLVSKFDEPDNMDTDKKLRLKKALHGQANGYANNHGNQGYVNSAFTHDRSSAQGQAPQRSRADIYTIDEDRGNISDDGYRNASDYSRFSDDRPRYENYVNDRSRYPDERSRYPDERSRYPDERSRYPDERSRYPDERSRYSDERSRYPDERSRYPDERSRYPDERSRYPDNRSYPNNRLPLPRQPEVVPNGYPAANDYRYQPHSAAPRPGVVYGKKDKDFDEVDSGKKSHRCCLIIVILVIAILIIAGIVTVVVLHFLGFFSSSPVWKDGYNVEATFVNAFTSGMEDSESDAYKNAETEFLKQTSHILDSSDHKDGYDVTLNEIKPGSTIYLCLVRLITVSDTETLKKLLSDGFRNSLYAGNTTLDLLNIVVKPDPTYNNPGTTTVTTAETITTTTKAITETTATPEVTTLYSFIPERTTPSPPSSCVPMNLDKCNDFNYNKYGTDRQQNFQILDKISETGCYAHALEFACTSNYPPCSDDSSLERFPCRDFCIGLRDGCKTPINCAAYLDDDVPTLCYLSPDGPPSDEKIRPSDPAACGSGEIQCGDGTCKPNSKKCDGNNDCSDASDEIYCTGVTVSTLDCDFDDNNMCSYMQNSDMDFRFTVNTGPTGSKNTGPKADHTTRDTGGYALAEGSGQYPYSMARLTSAQVTPDLDMCLRFYYHMWGDQVESLKVYRNFSQNAELEWQRTRDQGDTWKSATVTLAKEGDNKFRVVFEAVRGDGYRSDIAIDDITVREGPCPAEHEGCDEDSFTCSNGNCVLKKFECDSVDDCGDFTDEKNCECNDDEFKCTFGMCINLYERCDGKNDCPDNSDELGCSVGTVCSHGRHRCSDGTCILPEWLCDHEEDCNDGEDEDNCPVCAADEWQCRDNSCVKKTDVCNTMKDCEDGTDEDHCYEIENGAVRVTKNSPDAWNYVCTAGLPPAVHNEFCDLLGYEKVKTAGAKTITPTEDQKYHKYLDSSTADSLLQNLPLVSKDLCPTANVLTLECEALECGKPKEESHISAYVVNGKDAKAGQWPWQAGLYYYNNGWLFSCGGSLVGHHWIITAAHCVKYSSKPAHYHVILGATHRNGTDDPNRIGVAVTHIKMHPGFSDIILGDDIAILTLDRYITYNDFIKPICLPTSLDKFPTSALCYVSGFGRMDYYNTSSIATILQEAKVKQWSDAQCNASHINYSPKMICAGYKSGYISTCPGDSGGPLQCQDTHGHWKLRGVFSFFTKGCNVPEYPPVFTRTQKYLDWIHTSLVCAFVCDNKKCLMEADSMCNGVNDCGDFSDETDTQCQAETSLSCDFEDDYKCGWSGTFDRKQSVIEVNKGPFTDQTMGDLTGFFMYAAKESLVLVSPITTRSVVGCLGYFRHSRGDSSDKLEYAVVNNIPDDIVHGSQVDLTSATFQHHPLDSFDYWLAERLDLPVGRFVVVFRSTDPGYVTIDDVTLMEGSCASQLKDDSECAANEKFCDNLCVPAAHVCDYVAACAGFEDESSCGQQKTYECNVENYASCYIVQNSVDNQDFSLLKTGPERENAPKMDHTLQVVGGHVLLFDSKLPATNSFAEIILSTVVPSESCFKFFYHMNSTGILGVKACRRIQNNKVCTLLQQVQSQSTDDWIEMQLELETTAEEVVIYGKVGNKVSGTTQSYIAVDDISIIPGVCSDPTCRHGEFKCTDGPCVATSLTCDGINHCDDNSDEATVLCGDIKLMGPDMFRCNHGLFRQRHLRCDGTDHCGDNSDEEGCDGTCVAPEFSCDNSKCKNRYSKNDGHADCTDNSDESDPTVCDENFQFTCQNGDCIPGFRYCDNKPDCADASDEVPNCACDNRYHFPCNDGKCIPKEYACDNDHINHCAGGEDEDPNQCTFTCGTQTLKMREYCDANPQCDAAEDEPINCECAFGLDKCLYGGCIPVADLCDGKYDCQDHSDESGCGCNNSEFQCDSGMCIPKSKECDQRMDCDDFSDENNCECPANHFQCDNNLCILNSQKCDKFDDCYDASDEVGCACEDSETECSDLKTCIPTSTVCDREHDCPGGTEEATCSVTCGALEFECNYMEYSCITVADQCDGTYHCDDASDELNCEKLIASNVQAKKGNEWLDVCSSNWNPVWNDDICRRQGKGPATSHTEIALSRSKYMMVKDTVNPTTNPVYSPDMLTDVISCPSNKLLQINCADPTCGKPPATTSAMIIGGQTANSRSDIPVHWVVGVHVLGKYRCSGVIIGESWILTAAHCFQAAVFGDNKLVLTPQYVTVTLGTTKSAFPNSQITENDVNRIEKQVEEIIIHPEFQVKSNNALENDLALVKLKSVVHASSSVQYICRPPKSYQMPKKAKCYVAGWGITNVINNGANGNPPTIDMYIAKLDVSVDVTCGDDWGSDYNPDMHICAGGTAGSPSVCNGDSGGPLMCQQQNGLWEVVGLTSFGRDDCNTGADVKPGVFTRVNKYEDWIVQQINPTVT